LNQGLQDISLSRKKQDVSWGIELPFDKEHTCYVWVDAFWNYISGLKDQKKFWPAQVQLMANDILRVHATIWPALLLAMDKKLPNKMFIHGYFTLDGKKMSKSLGNYIDPADLLKKYPADSIRYFFMRNIPFGDDGDFSEKAMVERHNGELVNKFGNLITRVSSLIEKYSLEESEKKIEIENLEEIKHLIENLEFDKALNEIFSYIDKCNEYIQNQKPWETKDKKILYELADSIKKITILLYSFIPETCEKIAKQFHFKISLEEFEKPIKLYKIKKAPYIFERIEYIEENST
jgi:methionyl-tRNA synthetase